MKKFFYPYIYDLLVSLILFIGVPVIFITTNLISISFHSSVGVLVFLASVFLYIYFLASCFIPGIYAIMDLVTKNYVTEKMSYIECYIASNKFYGFKKTKKIDMEIASKIKLSEDLHLRVILAGSKGKTAFRTTRFHTMEKGRAYTVKYGKYSKVILSIVSSENEEMLLYD